MNEGGSRNGSPLRKNFVSQDNGFYQKMTEFYSHEPRHESPNKRLIA
jgi:hypothetical protein